MTRHRVYVVPLRPDVDVARAEAHWHGSHAALFARTPRMLGYVQDRPTPIAAHSVVCSQTWFADADAERAAYTSAHYVGPVADDEAGFVDRDAAWTALVRGAPPRLLVVAGATRGAVAPGVAEPGDLHLVTRPVVVVGDRGVSPVP